MSDRFVVWFAVDVYFRYPMAIFIDSSSSLAACHVSVCAVKVKEFFIPARDNHNLDLLMLFGI